MRAFRSTVRWHHQRADRARRHFASVVLDVLRVLKGGKSLADSLATQPEYFSELYMNMVRAGEASGSLAAVFERLAEFERTRDDLRSYIISSMVYPALLALVGLGSIFVLLTFVVPRFARSSRIRTMKIPLPTKIMLEASKIVQAYWWMAALAFARRYVLSGSSYTRTAGRPIVVGHLRLKIPVLGDALRKAETARFARAMRTLVANSVPLVQSIGIAGATLNNRRIAGSLSTSGAGSEARRRDRGAAAQRASFPPLAAHLLAVGEETGRLDQMFARMAEIYEAETRAAIRRFTRCSSR